MRQTLANHTDATNVTLEEMQREIEYDIHPSNQIFSELVKNIRDYAVKESRKTTKKNRKEEEQLVNHLVSARNLFNSVQPPSEIEINKPKAA